MEHLGTEKAAGVRVLRVAGHPDRPAVLHLDHEAAGVGAVVGADGTLDFGGHGDYLVLGEDRLVPRNTLYFATSQPPSFLPPLGGEQCTLPQRGRDREGALDVTGY